VAVPSEGVGEVLGHFSLAAAGELHEDDVGEGGVGGRRRLRQRRQLLLVFHRTERRHGPASGDERTARRRLLEAQDV